LLVVGAGGTSGRSGGRHIERRRFINYPRGRLLAVADDAATAERAAHALVEAGWDPAAIERISGVESAHAFDATGADHGWLARLGRLVQFTLMDQLPDLAWYEAAARDGRVVLMVRLRGAREARQAGTILAEAGAHFINRYGRFQTEQLARWRGPEPDVAERMKH
jgi:hypothetical protein